MKKSLGQQPLALPSPVWVVGSYGANEQPNIMVVAWGGICCTDPPCVAISIKKTRSTYANIIERNSFTINVPSKYFLVETDYLGIVSGLTTDKFSTSGLTAVKSNVVDAPYVQEFPLVIECKLLHALNIGLHTQFIGLIMDVKADEDVIGANGFPIAGKIDPLISSSSEKAYYSLGEYLDQAYLPGGVLVEHKSDESFV